MSLKQKRRKSLEDFDVHEIVEKVEELKSEIRGELKELMKRIEKEFKEEKKAQPTVRGYERARETAENFRRLLDEYAGKFPLSSGELAAFGRKLREWVEKGGEFA